MHNTMKANQMEKGQALVLIILAIVAILGFAALAVDLGRLYAERRRLQSAADSAALTAAMAGARGLTAAQIQSNTITQLNINGVPDTDPAVNPGQKVDMEFHHPPISGAYAGNPLYYQVIVHSDVDKVFSQFVYNGPLNVTVEAVARSDQSSGIFSGNAIVANSPDGCQALKFNGAGKTVVTGGNVSSFSNKDQSGACSQGDSTGGASCVSGVQEGSGTVNVKDGTINTVGNWNQNGGSGTVTSQGINECTPPQTMPHLPVPDCGSTARTYTKGDTTLSPGNYADGIIVSGNKEVLHLNPGLYCLDKDISLNGGVITGKGVMFYMRGGSVQLTGGVSVDLQAVTDSQSAPVFGAVGDPTFQWGGMLIYMPFDNTGEVFIGGNSGSRYTGTIYAPGPRQTAGQDKCIIAGSGTSLGLNSSVICDSVRVEGSANLTINYDQAMNFHMPAVMDMSQ